MSDQLGWRKATYSNGQAECVEVADITGRVLVRDTKQAHLADDARTVVAFNAAAWARFTDTLRQG